MLKNCTKNIFNIPFLCRNVDECNFSNNSGRRSPSTQEAIAGMLSIGQTYIPTGKGPKNSRKYTNSPLLEEENIKNVHQDEDYGGFFVH